MYPKDPKAGGTWFAIKENGVVTVLLNGAFKNHTPNEKHSVSRGLIVLQVISATDSILQIMKLDLSAVTPFTLVLFTGIKLLEFRWDGTDKHYKDLDPKSNFIWSSVTLYDTDAIAQREQKFTNFLKDNHSIQEESIINFHMNNDNDFENGFIINRKDQVKTFSITQAVVQAEEIIFNHLDLDKNQINSKKFSLPAMLKQFQWAN